MAQAISFRGVVKRYGAHAALDGLDLEVGHGEVFGFLGPNGAGKTTALRSLMDFIRPDAGIIEVLGRDSRRHTVAVHRSVGYLPADPAMHGGMSGTGFLDYVTRLRGGDEDRALRRQLVERFELDEHRRIHELSRGNRQKVALIQALMARPQVLVLDEPTTGLDPLMRRMVEDVLREMRQEGVTVFFSSHELGEVEAVCTRVAMLRAGRVIDVVDLKAEREIAPRTMTVRFVSAPPASAFASIFGLEDAAPDITDPARWHFRLRGQADPLIKRLAAFEVADLQTHEVTLEELFRAYYDSDTVGQKQVGRTA